MKPNPSFLVSVSQHFNSKSKTYTTKSLFYLCLLNCFKSIQKIDNGFPKLFTNNLNILPPVIQREIVNNFSSIWKVYFNKFKFDFISCSKHIDLSSGVVYPCCQQYLNRITSSSFRPCSVTKYKYKVLLNRKALMQLCKLCYSYLKINHVSHFAIHQKLFVYKEDASSFEIIKSFKKGYCHMCKIGSFSYSNLSFTNLYYDVWFAEDLADNSSDSSVHSDMDIDDDF